MSTAVMEKVRYGSKEIEFSLQHRKRKTLGITVFPDSSVRVTVPNGAAISKVKEKVRFSWDAFLIDSCKNLFLGPSSFSTTNNLSISFWC